MTTISHEPLRPQERRRWLLQLLVPEMWAALSIIVIWLAVLFTAVTGPNIETTSYLGERTVLPLAAVVALFAFLSTWAAARHGFRRR